MITVAFIGLGNMGSGMADNLVDICLICILSRVYLVLNV